MRRPLILNGFMATGKSTVGALVARTTGRPFIDLDHAIESETGASIESLFATRGEAAFRALERRCLERVLSEATAAAQAPRALRQGQRPLLSGPDPERRVSELLALRATSYSEAHARISSAAPLESVAAQVREVWSRDELAVAVGDASYSVQTGLGFASGRVGALIAESPVCVLVSDKTVAALHAAPIEAALTATGARLLRVDLEPGEAHKNIAAIERIWHAALAGGADRKATFVGLGGGVVTDMTGFAASTWMRGVRWVGLPTTLLAMVDASVGGKTGVDLASAKNAVGAFWQPSGVLCDVHDLGTESGRGFISGLAEAVKTALIGDPKLFELLEDNAERVVARDGDLTAEIVRRSIRVKA